MRWKKKIYNPFAITAIFSVLIVTINTVQADNLSVSDESTSDFFDDITISAHPSEDLSVDSSINRKGNWLVSGSFKFQSQCSTKDQLSSFPYSRQDKDFTQARSTLRLGVKGKLFEGIDFELSGLAFYDALYHQRRSRFSEQEFNAMADGSELRDTYLQFEIVDNLWLKIGKQVIALGESDYFQIVDVVNPRDEREFGLVDLEDARLPLFASRFSYVGHRWGLDLALLQEFASNRYSGKGADFDRTITLRNSVLINEQKEPDINFRNPDIVFRAFWSHAKGDISFIYGKTHDSTPTLALSSVGGNAVDEVFPKINTLGIAANWIVDHWVFKGELAHKTGVTIAKRNVQQEINLGYGQGEIFNEKSIRQTLLGAEYSAYQDIQLSTELATTKVLQYENLLAVRKTDSSITSRANFEFFRDTANIEFIWSYWLNTDDSSYRLVYTHNYTDQLIFSVGYIDFTSDNIGGSLYPYRNNDRLFGSITYSF